MKTFAIAASAAALILSAAGAALAHEPTSVTFEFETGERGGAVMVALFDSEAGYEGSRPVGAQTVSVSGRITRVTFEGLAPGDYAMKAFHDVDGDGEMDSNPFGMPTEPYAFSNNAVGNMGPARWDRARFEVAGPTVQTISIR
ncbi:DUF2141 domain-containing protein [Brevundimonas vitis]|uniref:DUF2141 domain-containing protein n=1 Tax=Brevundimonas vitisensis TaxID=2800818 RepID=A0ABX7BL23_9CAUL|nr:DUF2141 domain-containing protein [Brevundimonas vitisensis]QQQ17957.1 DUF2141 domain-containing protein [Brevundimonas vitisensis]